MTLTGGNSEEKKRDVLSVERTRAGFVMHLSGGTAAIRVSPSDRRRVEGAFRALGVIVVDEYGARIDDSQFAKEADPRFNRKVGPGFWGFFLMAYLPRFYFWWQRRRGRATIV